MSAQLNAVDLTEVRTSTQGPRFKLGATHVDEIGNEYVYGKSITAAKTAGLLYVINGQENEVDSALTTTVAASGKCFNLALAVSSPAQNGFGWFQVRGEFTLTTNGAVAANAKVYTTATAGKVDDDSSGTVLIPGLTAYAAIGSATTGTFFCGHRLYVSN